MYGIITSIAQGCAVRVRLVSMRSAQQYVQIHYISHSFLLLSVHVVCQKQHYDIKLHPLFPLPFPFQPLYKRADMCSKEIHCIPPFHFHLTSPLLSNQIHYIPFFLPLLSKETIHYTHIFVLTIIYSSMKEEPRRKI